MKSRPRHEHTRRHAQLLEQGTREHYLDPILYDFEYQDQEDDIDWYLSQAARSAGGTILELGAGSGRISIPLARAGHRLIALDHMPEMLAHLRAKLDALAAVGEAPAGTIEIVRGDMSALPLEPSSVALAIAPFNCLMHLYTWDQLLACFREVHRVLEPGGAFALDVLLPDLEWLQWDPDLRHALTEFVHPRTHARMYYSTNHSYDPETQVCHVRIYYDDYAAHPKGELREGVEPIEVVHLAHRQIFPEELRMLAGVAGFEIESHRGDFMDLSLARDIEVQAMICRKPKHGSTAVRVQGSTRSHDPS